MRKIFTISTILTVLFASIFRILHWPGSNELVIIGNGLLLPIWLTMNLIHDFKSANSKILAILSFASSFIFFVGLLFKMMHWPPANELLILSLFIFFPLFAVLRGHQRQKNQKGSAIIGWILAVFSWVLLFKLMAWPGIEEVYLFALGLVLPIFFIVLFVNREHLLDFKLGITSEKSVVYSTVFLAYLLTYLSVYVHSRALHSQVFSQDQLESQINREIELGDQFLAVDQKVFKDQLDKNASDVIKRIEDLKFKIMHESNGDVNYRVNLDELVKDNSSSKIKISNLDLRHLNSPYNFDIPTHYIIGNDIKTLSAHDGLRVYGEWVDYQEKRINMLEFFLKKHPNNSLERYIDLLQKRLKVMKEEEFGEYEELRNIHWISRNFLHLTTIQAIVRLTEIEYEIVRDRNEVLMQVSR